MVMSSLRKRPRMSGDNVAAQDVHMNKGWGFWRRYGDAKVNTDDAFSLPSFYRSVVLIASTIAAMPIKVYKETGDSFTRIHDDRTRYLWDAPNPEMDSETFWETVIGHEVLGNAFVFVVKDRRGDPAELWPLEPERVEVGRFDGRKVYLVDKEVPMVDFKQGGEIVHVMNFSDNGLFGKDIVRLAAGSIAIGAAADEYARRWYTQDATPGGLITTEQALTPEEAEAIANAWNAQSGMDNRHRARVLSKGAKFQPITVDPEKSESRATRSYTAIQFAQLLGIPPHLLGEVERSTSWGTGILEQNRSFLQFCLSSHILRFERAINHSLLQKAETGRYVKFETAGFLRPDTYHRYSIHAMALASSLRTPDEIRADEEMAPLPDGLGKYPVWYVQAMAKAEAETGAGRLPKVTDDTGGPQQEKAFEPPYPPECGCETCTKARIEVANGNGAH